MAGGECLVTGESGRTPTFYNEQARTPVRISALLSEFSHPRSETRVKTSIGPEIAALTPSGVCGGSVWVGVPSVEAALI